MTCRIRFSDLTPEIHCDENIAVEWVKKGKIQAHHQIYEDGQWILAKQSKLLHDVFASGLWDAWDDDSEFQDFELSIAPKKPNAPSHRKLPNEFISALAPNSQSQVKQNSNTQNSMTQNSMAQNASLQSKGLTNLENQLEFEKALRRDVQNIKERQQEEKPFSQGSQSDLSKSKVEEVPSNTEDFAQKNPTTVIPTLQTSEPPKANMQTLSIPKSMDLHQSDTNALAQLWNPDLSLRDQPQLWGHHQVSPKQKSISWLRVSYIVIPGAMAVLGWRTFVVSEAGMKLPEVQEIVQNAEKHKIPEDSTEYWISVENDLKSQLEFNLQTVDKTHLLEDALMIDLGNVDLSIVNLDTEVLSWKGRLLNIPDRTWMVIGVKGTGAIERDFAMVSMIVARYSQRYSLDMPSFVVEVTEDETIYRKTIQSQDAIDLLTQPNSLLKFYQKIFQIK